VRWKNKWAFDGKLCRIYSYLKNDQNPTTGFQVTIENVGDVLGHSVYKKNWDPYTHGNNYMISCFNGISFLPH